VHPAWKNRFHRQVEARYLNSVDGFIFNSRTTRSEVEKLVGASKPHVVAYPGRDHFHSSISRAQIAERAKESRPLRVLFLGNVIPRKGLHTLLEALALVPPEIWRLEVLGRVDIDRKYAEAIRRQIVKTDIGQQVEFRGLLPDADVAESLARSHILAVPSSYEGFGIIYLEGMGFGLPAIASTAGAAAELIADGEEGFLIAPNDAPNLARCIQMFSQNKDRLLQMSLKALERHGRFPSWEESMGSVRRLLESLV
jgi:glycosyltransferase involved in cell wall biosynthesis